MAMAWEMHAHAEMVLLMQENNVMAQISMARNAQLSALTGEHLNALPHACLTQAAAPTGMVEEVAVAAVVEAEEAPQVQATRAQLSRMIISHG